ncbi:MAG: SpoIIE family protein phosphatase [Leptospirales bacterium]|nr:SpoIIE family protein phosphatase [Leptospirales bacterium]
MILFRRLPYCSMTNEADESRERLKRYSKALVDLTRAVDAEDFSQAIRRSLEITANALSTERASIWMFTEDNQELECLDLFESSSAKHSGGFKLAATSYPAYFAYLNEARCLAASDAHTNPSTHEFSESYLKPNNIFSLLDAPILVNGRMRGVVCHEQLGQPRNWTQEEETFAGSIGDIISRGFELHSKREMEHNARADLEKQIDVRTHELKSALAELEKKNKRNERELLFASEVQQGVFGGNLRNWNGISFGRTYHPMVRVSGDYYDIIRRPDSVYVVIADASGHGVPAALITMLAKQTFATAAETDANPGSIMRQANATLTKILKQHEYLTAFVLQIDQRNRAIYSSAGHPPAIHYHKKDHSVTQLGTEGVMIGTGLADVEQRMEEKELRIRSGDRILLYTDGVIEQRNASGEEFGYNRLVYALLELSTTPIGELTSQIFDRVREFSGGLPITDDATLVAVELSPNWRDFMNAYNLGVQALSQKDVGRALLHFEEAGQFIQTHPELRYAQAKALSLAGRWSEAARAIEECLNIKRNDPRALRLAFSIFMELKKVGSAEEIATFLLRLKDARGKQILRAYEPLLKT